MTSRSPRYRVRRPHFLTVVAAVALLAQGCATLAPQAPQMVLHAPTAFLSDESDTCRTGWAPSPEQAEAALDPARIALVNWNIKKGSHTGWRQQFELLTRDADLVTLQEAPLVNPGWEALGSDQYHAFAPGWLSRHTPTGVMTLSDAAHLVQCNLQEHEPWLRSPKAMLATEYALTDRPESLLVFNVHVVNFSLGLSAFDRQLEQIHGVVSQHRGPVILTGDFNTWRQARLERLLSLVADHDLEPVSFRHDLRKRFMGRPLDHVYVRGLQVLDATTVHTRASDHNPMQVWLSAI